jgi:hypothetical protein
MIFDLARFFSYHIVPQAGGDTQKVEIHVTLKPSETTLSRWRNYLYTHDSSIAPKCCDRRANKFKNKQRVQSRSAVPTLALRRQVN